MKPVFRLLALSLLASFGGQLLLLSARAAPQSVVAVKLHAYTQTAPGDNFSPAESALDVELRFGAPVAGTSATLHTPSGSHALNTVDENTLGALQAAASPAALDGLAPEGSYRLALSGGSSDSYTFSFPGAALAPAAITNYAFLQDTRAASVTVQWNPLPLASVAEGVVLLEIFRGNGEVVWRSNGLSAASRSATATGLPADQPLYGVLTYGHMPLVTTDNFLVAVGRATSVRFPIGTGGATGTNTPPAISAHPLSQSLEGRSSVTLAVGLFDSLGATFQWHKDGAPIAGANQSSLTATTPGFYTVAVTNSSGTTTSNAAIVTANASSETARLYAISCRARVGTGGDILIPGMLIGGSGQRQVLVRAGGPAIQGVNGVLAQPQLAFYQVGISTPVATNSGWSSGSASATSALQAAFSAANLPAYPTGSADCALIATVSAGAAYTATVSGVGNGTGVGLVEVYELGAGSARIVALSCRARVGTGDDVLIPGIIVAGDSAKTLIVRAKGPGIEGVAGTLAQPKLELFTGAGVRIAENTGWMNAPNVAAISAATAAAGLSPLSPGAADCAIVATLPPGGYTAKVSGVNGSSGVALVEVYEVP
ncbi:MAG TPA: hypothetical protein VHO24_09945 [Opitutaceae bacterium]|nr:hypothetical protein [Opitutaceae bacterium]